MLSAFSFLDIGTYIAAAIGIASAAVRLIEQIAGVTPNTADDEFAGKARRTLGKVVAVADRLALNPPASQARDG